MFVYSVSLQSASSPAANNLMTQMQAPNWLRRAGDDGKSCFISPKDLTTRELENRPQSRKDTEVSKEKMENTTQEQADPRERPWRS